MALRARGDRRGEQDRRCCAESWSPHCYFLALRTVSVDSRRNRARLNKIVDEVGDVKAADAGDCVKFSSRCKAVRCAAAAAGHAVVARRDVVVVDGAGRAFGNGSWRINLRVVVKSRVCIADTEVSGGNGGSFVGERLYWSTSAMEPAKTALDDSVPPESVKAGFVIAQSASAMQKRYAGVVRAFGEVRTHAGKEGKIRNDARGRRDAGRDPHLFGRPASGKEQ